MPEEFDNADLMGNLPDAFTPFSAVEFDELKMFVQPSKSWIWLADKR